MKKIIRPGNNIKECEYCNCLFSYEDEDVFEEQTIIRGQLHHEEFMIHKKVKCPCCNQDLIVHTSYGGLC